MEAYRIKTIISDDGIIRLPKEYEAIFSRQVEMIIFKEDPDIYQYTQSLVSRKGIKKYSEEELDEIIHASRKL